MSSKELALEANQLVKRYSSSTSIGPVSLTVQKGATFGFLGPNGSGKTTTIRMMLGLIRPEGGSAKIFGIDPADNPKEALSRVGYAPELPTFQTFFTAEQLLNFTAGLYGIDRGARGKKVRELLQVVGISDHSQKKIGKFSKGMVQRLAVAQALINDPELVMMDEPTIGMDPAATIYFRDLFKNIHSQGKTIFVSSHLLDEVQRLCTHVGMIYRGRMVFQGSISEILARFGTDMTIEAELRELTPSILEHLKKLHYVQNLSTDMNKILITVKDGEDFRSELAEEIIKGGGKLVGLSLRKATLEDVFIETLRRGAQHE